MKFLMGILDTSFVGTISIVVAIIIFSLCKRYSAKCRKNVWILISIALLFPFWNRINLPVDISVSIPDVVIREYTEENEALYATSKDTNTETAKLKENERPTEITIGDVLTVLWVSVSVALAIYYLAGYVKMHRKMLRWSSRCEEAKVKEILLEIATELKLKNIPELRIMQDSAKGPFTTGVKGSIIFLPAEKLNEKDLQYILKHEAVHCKEKDILWKLLFLSVAVLHWFNPFVWLMRRFAEQDMEVVCDEGVLEGTALEERKEYSEVIMSMVGKSRDRGNVFTTGYVCGANFLKWRFSNIFNTDCKKNGRVLICGMGIGILLIGCFLNMEEGKKIRLLKEIPIDYGIEVRTDLNGDGELERVTVRDNVSGVYAFTQVCVRLQDGNDIFKDYPDYWSSCLVTGDLTGNGCADIVVFRSAIGSTYGGGTVTVLHMEKDSLEEYPCNFIKNPSLKIEQPENFNSENFAISPLGVTIIQERGKTMLRIIVNEDISNDIAKCIDCSYRKDGWFIENVQIIHDYYSKEKDVELLGNAL